MLGPHTSPVWADGDQALGEQPRAEQHPQGLTLRQTAEAALPLLKPHTAGSVPWGP